MPANARQSSSLIDVTGLGVPADRPPLSGEELAALSAGKDAAADNMGGLMSRIRSGGEKVTRANLRRSRTQRDEALHALASYGDQGRPLVFIMGVQDRERELETRLLVRGELGKPGQVVQRNFPQVIGGRFDQDQPASTSLSSAPSKRTTAASIFRGSAASSPTVWRSSTPPTHQTSSAAARPPLSRSKRSTR